MAGKFIVFEGPDGSGKTTQIKLLGEQLSDLGYDIIYTREPGGTRISEKIREILLDPENSDLNSKTEAMLYAAARAQHVEQLIKPQLAENKFVICDRFEDSTLAYQGFGRQLDIEYLREVNNMATGKLKPDLAIVIDINPETGIKRIMENRDQSRQSGTDRIEQEEITFHHRVRQGFLTLAKADLARYLVVNGERDKNEISEEIYTQVKFKLKL